MAKTVGIDLGTAIGHSDSFSAQITRVYTAQLAPGTRVPGPRK